MEKIVSVAKARRLLGKKAVSLSDDQVKQMIHMLHLYAREQAMYNGSKVSTNHEEPEQPTTTT